MALPVTPGSALLVVGSQAWNPADRTLGRDRIRSVWVTDAGGRLRHCPFLDPLGPHGVRDLLPLGDGRLVVSNGYDLRVLDPASGAMAPWDLEDVSDLHEVRREGARILVANTQRDELVELDGEGHVRRRRDLSRFRHERARPIGHDRRLGGALGGEATHADHFHLNQGFAGHDGHTWVLVHHTAGYRPVTHVRQRLTGHGGGGVIDLDDGRVCPLGLRAPHSVRRLGDGYVLLDSGRGDLVRYDRRWTEVGRHPVGGWGRGAAVDEQAGVVHVGLSATRARYLRPGQDPGTNRVVAFDTASWTALGEVEVPGVEQLWSVRLVDATVADALVGLGTAPAGSGPDDTLR